MQFRREDGGMNVRVALVGNPNSGKSTLFNALTGKNQKVGNWPGVTVEKKEGYFSVGECQVSLIDLPGIYTLTTLPGDNAIDSRLACEAILAGQIDCMVNIVDACQLERNLYLTAQLLEMGIPLIIGFTKCDLAAKQGLKVDVLQLAERLQCPVIPLYAIQQQGLAELQRAIVAKPLVQTNFNLSYPTALTLAQQSITQRLPEQLPTWTWRRDYIALRLLEGDALLQRQFANAPAVMTALQQAGPNLTEDADILIADTRYSWAHSVTAQVVKSIEMQATSLSSRIDHWALHRFLGIPIFLGIMYLMFYFAMSIGGCLQDFFDMASDALFVQGATHVLQQIHCPAWLVAVLASGIGKGINTTLTFIPVLAGLFFSLAFLEDSGYMARAACVVDRLMRALGLPSKAFIPLIVGFGCNVPAVMAARTLETRREQILTVLMTPFMSCGARLAIYAIFTSAFFPAAGQNIIFALYLLGIVLAIATAYLLRKTLLPGEHSPLILELPPYQLPPLKNVVGQAWQRLQSFILRAAKVIIPLCLLIGALNAVTVDGTLVMSTQQTSLLAAFGKMVTPFFAPMGIQQDNWPATVGLMTGLLAKEVVIASLNTLYLQAAHVVMATPVFDFWQTVKAAGLSIPAHLPIVNHMVPALGAVAKQRGLSSVAYGQMAQRFDGVMGAMAYLLFILLYSPCISTIAAIAREINWRWAIFAVVWTTGVAYIVAVLFYQIATVFTHPWQTMGWVGLLAGLLGSVILTMRCAWVKRLTYATG